MRSVEQSQDFQIARRVASLVAPGWRLLATSQLEPNALAIDFRKCSIELGENSEPDVLLASSMYALGHIRLKGSLRFRELFGFDFHTHSDDKKLIRKLATQGALADRHAVDWARRALAAFWPIRDCSLALRVYAWQKQDWHQYFSTT